MKLSLPHILLVGLLACNDTTQIEKQPEVVQIKVDQAKGFSPKATKAPRTLILTDLPQPLKADLFQKSNKLPFLMSEKQPVRSFHVMQHYSTSTGLPLDAILSCIADKSGNMWFGSHGAGATRYDGKSFTYFGENQGLIMGHINHMMEDTKGNIWFATLGGVGRYNGESFTNFTTAQGLNDLNTTRIVEDKQGNVWVGTYSSVARFDGQKFRSFTEIDGSKIGVVKDLFVDSLGNIWIASAGNGVSKFNGMVFKNLTIDLGLHGQNITGISEDKTGKIWISTTKSIYRYDGLGIVDYTKEVGQPKGRISGLYRRHNGDIWIKSQGEGAIRYDGKAAALFNTENGLPSKDITSLCEDAIGNLWFATDGKGVSRYDGDAFINFVGTEDGERNYVRSILEDSSRNLWFASISYIRKYDGKSYETYKVNRDLSKQGVFSLFKDTKGNIWIGLEPGVVKFNGTSLTHYTAKQGFPDAAVWHVLEDRHGDFWFATYGGGVVKIDATNVYSYTTEQGLANNSVTTIFEDKAGNLWFGTNGGGVSKFDGRSFVNFDLDHGLPSNLVMQIEEDEKGILWFATGQGLSRYDGNYFLNFTIANGLSDNFVYRAKTTQEKTIIAGTNKGVSILKGFVKTTAKGEEKIPTQNALKNEELENYAPVFEVYNTETGYPVKDINVGQNSLIQDSNGVFWFGTGSAETGLVRFDYSALHKKETPPQLIIQKVSVNGENISWFELAKAKHTLSKRDKNISDPVLIEEFAAFGRLLNDKERDLMLQKFEEVSFDSISRYYPVPQNLVLPHTHNNVTIEFAAIQPVRPQNVLYQYKLEGYDREWSVPSTKTAATFGNIFEGQYTLYVKARTPDSTWSAPIAYAFTVQPPWYRTWWAYSIYLISTVLLLFLVYRWRTASLRKRQRELEELYTSAERFLPKAFLQILDKKSFREVNLGDSMYVEVGVMFSDIRGFTSLTEKLGPKRAADFLNRYFGYMAPIVRKYNGVVGQFLGDGILAFFDPDPEMIIGAALEMQKVLPDFNKDLREEFGVDPIGLGFGLNIGSALFSIVGERERLEGHVVSDEVNLASRVESLNKFYKTSLLVTEHVALTLLNQTTFVVRIVDKIIVAGKSKAIRVYEIQRLPEGVEQESAQAYAALFNEAFAAYERADFARAQDLFESCLKKRPDDAVTILFIDRCTQLQKSGAPEGWDGTYKMTEK